MKSDSLFYKLFQILPEVLLSLAGEDTVRAAEYRFHSVEVKDHAFRLDGVLALADYRDQFFFVEVQYQKDQNFYRRLFAEIMTFLYQQRPEGEWRVVVIFPKRSIDVGVSADFREYHASGRLMVIYLNELPASLISAYPLNLLQLVNAPPQKAVIAPITQEILSALVAQEQDRHRRDDVERLVARIISVKLPQLSVEEIRAMIEPTLREFEKTRFYRDIEELAIKKGLEQGLEKGLEQGLEKGLERGVEKGAQEKQEAIAINLAVMGLMTAAQIAEATGLSLAEVKKLQKRALRTDSNA